MTASMPRHLFKFIIVFPILSAYPQQVLAQNEDKMDVPTENTKPEFGVVCVTNNTTVKISAKYRWKTQKEDWTSRVFNPGESQVFSWPYKSKKRISPDFWIKFDSQPREGWQERFYNLKRKRSTKRSCKGGRQYQFKMKDNWNIDLYER